jgi:hypothetical protein
MLKTIVQHNGLRLKPLDSIACGGHAIGILQMRHVGEHFRQFEGLIVGLACFRSIPSTDHGNADAPLNEPSCDPSDHGRFARAAERQIPYADHRHTHTMDGGLSAIVASVAPLNSGRIKALADAKNAAQHARPDAVSSAADNIAKLR